MLWFGSVTSYGRKVECYRVRVVHGGQTSGRPTVVRSVKDGRSVVPCLIRYRSVSFVPRRYRPRSEGDARVRRQGTTSGYDVGRKPINQPPTVSSSRVPTVQTDSSKGPLRLPK